MVSFCVFGFVFVDVAFRHCISRHIKKMTILNHSIMSFENGLDCKHMKYFNIPFILICDLSLFSIFCLDPLVFFLLPNIWRLMVLMKVIQCFDIQVLMKVIQCFDIQVLMKVIQCFDMQVLMKVIQCFDSQVLMKVIQCFDMQVLMKVTQGNRDAH